MSPTYLPPDIYKHDLKIINIDYTGLFEESLCLKYEKEKHKLHNINF